MDFLLDLLKGLKPTSRSMMHPVETFYGFSLSTIIFATLHQQWPCQKLLERHTPNSFLYYSFLSYSQDKWKNVCKCSLGLICLHNVCLPSLCRLIATELARIHCIHAHNGCIPKPNLWVKMRKYMALVSSEFTPEAKNTRIQKKVPPLETLEKEMAWMKEYLSELNSPTVLCHNDLLCKNIIYNEKEGWVKFIDYEYSSYNYQAFDIGNHFNEFAGVNEVDYSLYPDQSLQFQWLRTYLEACKQFTKKGGEVTDNEVQLLYVQVNKFSLASHFFWGFWALIQAKYSTIDFDFLGYSVLRFNQYFKMKPQVIVLQMPA
ncbi:ethanolamine kinase 1-like [Rhincodon typus]|uniref:ethanolamine kinase 1-like n=1 Tax=Rhincodon typus TaxID=259920 RepID=UPI002030A258|nr:ethanolamine kinase 1-like [Rhincodon typus]